MGLDSPLKALLVAVILLGIAGLLSAFLLQVETDVSEDFTASSLEANATLDAMEGQAALTEKFPTMSNIIIAVAIITLLLGGFGAFIYNKVTG